MCNQLMKESTTLKVSYRTRGDKAVFFILQSTLFIQENSWCLGSTKVYKQCFGFCKTFVTVYAVGKPLNILEYL